MALTLVGFFNLTVAIIDRQFIQSIIAGQTKDHKHAGYSRKLYECINRTLPLYMMCVVWVGLHYIY